MLLIVPPPLNQLKYYRISPDYCIYASEPIIFTPLYYCIAEFFSKIKPAFFTFNEIFRLRSSHRQVISRVIRGLTLKISTRLFHLHKCKSPHCHPLNPANSAICTVSTSPRAINPWREIKTPLLLHC